MIGDALHPDLLRVGRWLPRAAISRRTLWPVRMLTRATARGAPKGIAIENVGQVSVRVHQPVSSDQPLPALLWIHGGGFVMGSAAQDDVVCRHFANTLRIVVAAVEYRLAPEHPFPVPLHDCYEALSWLVRQPSVDPTRIAIGGASAGGGLAAALGLLVRERGEMRLAFQLLSYPMLDDRTACRTGIDGRVFRMWNNKANHFAWQSYIGGLPGSAGVSALAAPARCDDLAGLPPAWIGVGTLDLFYEEDVAYARRLKEAGVECQLDVITGAFHGFDSVLPKAVLSQDYRAAQSAALGAALHKATPDEKSPVTGPERPLTGPERPVTPC